MLKRSEEGIAKALTMATSPSVVPTYFTFEVTERETRDGGVQVNAFKAHTLPLFLEGPVRHLKTIPSLEERRSVHEAVKASELYDKKLKMYAISGSLAGQPFEIGRMMAFNPGWLENQSIWLHMSYKYYLELLRGGLYDEFFTEIQDGLVCFMDSQVFGRSPLEAASFIVSSAFPDEQLHGAGFLARLSGSTAEFLSMWNIMMAGQTPFSLDDEGALQLTLKPVIASWMWSDEGTVSFTFLGSTTVTYHNEAKSDTYGDDSPPAKKVFVSFVEPTMEQVAIEGGVIPKEYAEMVRDKLVSAIDMHF